MATFDRNRPHLAWLWKTAALAACLGLGTWLLLAVKVPREAPDDLPKVPDLRSHNAELRRLVGDADAEARRRPN
jgi:hypothetical protein